MTSLTSQEVAAKRLILRVAAPEFEELQQLVFRRYPNWEWATFARFGWRDTGDALVVTLAGIDPPQNGDLDKAVGHVAFDEHYSLRMALAAEKHVLAVGVIHSHPENCAPLPSTIDDDMDGYYSQYFADFAPNRPYVSLIFSIVAKQLVISGRIFWGGKWLTLERTAAEGEIVGSWPSRTHKQPPSYEVDRAARFLSAFGEEAFSRLRGACATIIGAGGTGSAAIEVLARAGIGRLVIVDPDVVERSNLERIHGSVPGHAKNKTPKVVVARELVHQIDPSIAVVALQGRVPQSDVIDAVVTSDIALGCTDQQHSRLALSDLAFRYLVPVIDCGVVLEGEDGTITGQVAQFVRLLASDPCVLCRNMIDPRRVAQELMSSEERAQRAAAAAETQTRGGDPDPYWQRERQINTVGYLTSAVGAMLAGYAIGWLTRRFDPPFERLQMNFVAPFLDVTDLPQKQRPECACAKFRGWADQASAEALVSTPSHWPPVRHQHTWMFRLRRSMRWIRKIGKILRVYPTD